MMKTNRWVVLAAVGCTVTAWIALANGLIASKTFRSTAFFRGVQQGTDSTTQLPQYDPVPLAGWNLVNLARGRAITDTTVSNEVLAITFLCDLNTASLVVYDRATSNTFAFASGALNVIHQERIGRLGKTNETARFVAHLTVPGSGTASNGLAGGYLTVAGRLHMDSITGCPKSVLVAVDKDPNDRQFADKDVLSRDDRDDVRLVRRAGLAHAIGVIDLITGGTTNAVLVPHGNLSFRRELPTPPAI
jgi:hypothetical protein